MGSLTRTVVSGFVGIDPPAEVTPKEQLEEGEKVKGWGVWKGDLYGVGEVPVRGRFSFFLLFCSSPPQSDFCFNHTETGSGVEKGKVK